MLRPHLLVVAILFAMAAPVAAQGPVGRYYLTAGDQGTNWTIQGLTATSFAQANPDPPHLGEYAIAVTSFVRTLGNGNTGAGLGSEYTLNMVYTGNNFVYPSPGVLAFYDGTSDGNFNYAVDYFTGNVYRMNLNWSNPTLLFNSNMGASSALGITYDRVNNSLWVSSFAGNLVQDFSLAGVPLSSFNAVGFGGSLSCLAMDYATNTLWMGSQAAQGTFREYSRTGTPLQTQVYATMAAYNTLGGEFSVVPEPSSVLCALAIACTMSVRRRRRII